MKTVNIMVFVGARPNIPKAWTLLRALKSLSLEEKGQKVAVTVVHSGQHYHELMGEGFAERFDIDVGMNLQVGSGNSDAEQLANLLLKIDEVMEQISPDCTVVIGDVNTTIAAALSSSRRGIPVVHLEAGLRAGDWDPEEINRKVITAVSNYHLAPSSLAQTNLLREGIDKSRIYLVGNTMAETFIRHADARKESKVLERLGLKEQGYVLFTVHKSHNLTRLTEVLDLLVAVSQEQQVVFPCHPHTAKLMRERMQETGGQLDNVLLIEPQTYHDFGRLMESSWCTVTDSAGLQEECTVAGIPCFTIGPGTARPETVYYGTNHIIGYEIDQCLELITNPPRGKLCPPYWDVQVGERLRVAFTRILQDMHEKQTKKRWIIRPAK